MEKSRRIAAFALGTATLMGSAAPALATYTISDLVSFNGTNGENPLDGMILVGSTLYGTTENGGLYNYGEVYSLPLSGGSPNILASFNNTDGAQLQTGLTVSGNTLYGTATVGTTFGGEVFSLPITGGTPNVVANLGDTYSYTSRLVLSGNTLFGATRGLNSFDPWNVFAVPSGGGTPTVLASGVPTHSQPDGNLVLSGNTLYGTMSGVSGSDPGYIYSVPATGGTPTILAAFPATNNGLGMKMNGLILSGNTLYGTTTYGGLNGVGEVFSEPITGGTPTVLASFNGNGLTDPWGQLTLSGSTLYGTTSGASNTSGVFSVPVTGGTPTLLASFHGPDGEQATGGLVVTGNAIYGTTESGGQFGMGTIFTLVTTPQVISFTTSAPTAFGANLGALNTLSGQASNAFTTTQSGYFQVSPWPSSKNTAYYGLTISDSVPGSLSNDLSLLADEINNMSYGDFTVVASTTDPDSNLVPLPPGGYNLFLTITGSPLPTTDYFGFDLSQYIVNSDVLNASGIAVVSTVPVVPEPASIGLLTVTGLCLVSRRVRQRRR